MSDLIRRSELRATFERECIGECGCCVHVKHDPEGCDLVDNAPAVDAEPVRHGRWIPNIRTNYKAYPPYEYRSGYKCTLCGRVERSNKEPYCHCGAKMDEEV